MTKNSGHRPGRTTFYSAGAATLIPANLAAASGTALKLFSGMSCFNVGGAQYASISRGSAGIASGAGSSIGGSDDNKATAQAISVSGGGHNKASGPKSSVSGVAGNKSEDEGSSILGGAENTAIAPGAAILGGRSNKLAAEYGEDF
jgi:hypothetical protein